MTDSAAPVLLSRQGPVAVVTLNRPERMNALGRELVAALRAAFHELANDSTVSVIVLTGTGKAFCAGADLREREGMTTDEARAFIRSLNDTFNAVEDTPQPVIAAINGVCMGGGFELALACDLRLLSASATVTAGYVRRGLSPDAGVTWFLPRLIGHARATDIILTGRDVRAEEAERIGLATAVYPEDVFSDSVHRYAAQLAAGPPLALALSKRLLLASPEATLDAQLREEFTHIKSCFASADVREALAAFKEKRAPTFEGR
jgi:2-(1,2-epoxy-1,2-dihydrophenyl)acetyl-CoA isomerase